MLPVTGAYDACCLKTAPTFGMRWQACGAGRLHLAWRTWHADTLMHAPQRSLRAHPFLPEQKLQGRPFVCQVVPAQGPGADGAGAQPRGGAGARRRWVWGGATALNQYCLPGAGRGGAAFQLKVASASCGGAWGHGAGACAGRKTPLLTGSFAGTNMRCERCTCPALPQASSTTRSTWTSSTRCSRPTRRLSRWAAMPPAGHGGSAAAPGASMLVPTHSCAVLGNCPLQDLAEGKGRETKAIEYPEPRQRISFHP